MTPTTSEREICSKLAFAVNVMSSQAERLAALACSMQGRARPESFEGLQRAAIIEIVEQIERFADSVRLISHTFFDYEGCGSTGGAT